LPSAERMDRIDEELFQAARDNNLPELRRLVSVGADVNYKHVLGSTPLHAACFDGHEQVVKELVEHGADIEAADIINGRTPLIWASSKGYSQVVKELMEHGADTEARDRNHSTSLHCASRMGHVAVINELLCPAVEIRANDGNGATTSLLGKRKSRGADIGAKDEFHNTPLHWASMFGYLPIVKALVSGGADIRAVNWERRLPINQAVTYGHSAVVKYLLQHFYATTRRLPLHELLKDLTFSWIGNTNSSGAPPPLSALDENVLGTDDVVKILEYLVDRNPELLSSRDLDSSLPLHVACGRGAPFSIVQSLVNLYRASVKSVTSQGDLPLFLACEIPTTSLDTIFILMKLYPELVYR
jgi:ankyrin repeat protein